MSNAKIALILIAALLLIVPSSALWTIEDPRCSGYVVFQDSQSGYAHIQYGPVQFDQPFAYDKTGPEMYLVKTEFLGTHYEIPLIHDGERVVSPDFPGSVLIWIP